MKIQNSLEIDFRKSSTEKLPTNDLKANDFLTDPQSEQPIKSGEIITKGLECKTNGTNGTNGRLRSINYVNNDHLSAIFSSLNYMRKNGQLCDIILQVAGSQLKAHKVVLSATSAYFNAMFNIIIFILLDFIFQVSMSTAFQFKCIVD